MFILLCILKNPLNKLTIWSELVVCIKRQKHTHSHTPYTACAEIGTAIRMIKKE